MVRLLLIIVALSFGGCKTAESKDETVTPGDISASAPFSDEPASPRSGHVAAPPAILSEPLRPVRGGQRVLPPYTGQDPCKMALAGESPVAKACSDGGIRRATELMQTYVKRARAVGIIFDCSDCHADEDDFSKLTAQAEPEFRKLLFLARPGD